ncbi:MAG: tRNA-specific adenosine deaminase [Spirochaetes bacterium GWF1_31_7]|nr:MAG: tRNA-specific adenosine deaminase [Spirochaetes bacterium GWE1_32_154]OHD49912.1 MAG: tRNA-specific adenosine deaminase [Spirochaetes bacterium GWF1_31_7]OHD52789.1 MAG: tRNA-specific adenosine deaminase [Spirochaetes bacterium GWE2_31_10]HBD92948.1 nucleoside deaminase [Spirochaetia bacterium]HBI37825.1 nucleoside deaminase [Spirochaetia bacterium]
MDVAIIEAKSGVENGDGGPFGAVVIHNGIIVGKGHNEVVLHNDPTAHAEIVAIRRACAYLGRFDLSDCELYTTCEPCPMCFAAVQWAGIKKVYYGCNRDDAAQIGFDDKLIYDILNGNNTTDGPEMINCCRDESFKIFEMWYNKNDKVQY